jgi:threonine/homoserine/homoserine lactone efflux protein
VSFESALALIGFAFVMTISPGPSIFLLLASGANFGFARSIRLVLGITTGFLTMVLGLVLVWDRFWSSSQSCTRYCDFCAALWWCGLP